MDNVLLGMLVMLGLAAFALAGSLVLGLFSVVVSLGCVALLRAGWSRWQRRTATVTMPAPRDGDSERR